MQILEYIIGFIMILAVIFVPIFLIGVVVPFLVVLLFRVLRGILYSFLDLFTSKKRMPGYWSRNFGRESLGKLFGKCVFWGFHVVMFFLGSDDSDSSDSGSSGGGGSFGGGGAGRSF